MDEPRYLQWLENLSQNDPPQNPTRSERLHHVDRQIIAFFTSPAFRCIQEDTRLPASGEGEIVDRWRSTLDVLDDLFDERFYCVN